MRPQSARPLVRFVDVTQAREGPSPPQWYDPKQVDETEIIVLRRIQWT